MAMEPGGRVGKLAAADRPLTAEEEAMKRNTDCVYFLASPLTCKKGSECEYRHSESARLNPRDCRYWLYGNCSNPNCSYRHPPLDGLYGLPGTTPAPSSQTVVTTQTLPVNAPSYNHKKNTACYYFQMRQCMKGDRCPYMHGPQPTGTFVPQKAGKVSASLTESPQTLKEAWFLKKCIQQETPKTSVDKPNEVLPTAAKPVTRAEINPSNGLAFGRNPSSYPLVNELLRSQPINDPASSGIAISMSRSRQSHPREECLQNSKDADELLGESSPGFDVLVDNDIKDTDYLQNEHDFGRESVQGGRDLFSATDFNYDDSDYEPVASFEKDHYNGMDGYDSYRRLHNNYGREQQRPSPEKIMGSQKMPERRVRRRESPDEMDSSDLRHRLLKQRRISGSRSTVSPNHCSEPFHNDARLVEGERYSGHRSHKDRRCFHSERSVSTRLQGRITLPGSSSTYRLVDSRSDREWDRVRHSNRLSPGRPINYPERHDRVRHSNRLSPGRPINYPDRHDRVKRRIHEHFAADIRKFGAQNIRRDNRNSLDFAGPKSLAELKNQQQSVKSRITARLSPEPSMKLGKPLNFPESDVSLSFEGPKPLSDILKTKRENAPENSEISSNDGNNHSGSATGSSESATVSDHQRDRSPEAIKGLDSATNIQMSKVGSFEESENEEGLIPEAGEYVQSPAKDTVEMEEGQMVTDENRVLQNFDQINKWDYEAAEGGDAKPEDDDNYYQENEELYDDDEDEDDFARKVGAMFS